MVFDFLLRAFGRGRRIARPDRDDTTEESLDADDAFPEVVEVEFRDVIDLHSIPPRQVRAVVEDYLEEARRRRVRYLRIIHGKGVGVQREVVRSVLARTPFVADYRDAPAEAGGWGATVVTLNTEGDA